MRISRSRRRLCLVELPPMRVNLSWHPRLKERMILVAVCRAHRQGASLRDRRTEHIPTPVRPRTLPESRALGLTGRWVTGDPAVSERRALPARSTDRHVILTRARAAAWLSPTKT
jgi:hypothetical protein